MFLWSERSLHFTSMNEGIAIRSFGEGSRMLVIKHNPDAPHIREWTGCGDVVRVTYRDKSDADKAWQEALK